MNMRPLSLAALSLGFLLPLGASAAPASRAKTAQSSKKSQSAKKKGSQLERKIQSGLTGVRVGMNFANMSYESTQRAFGLQEDGKTYDLIGKSYSGPSDTSTQMGFDAGLVYDTGFAKIVGFRGVASVSMRGTAYDGVYLKEGNSTREVDAYMNLWHVQLTPMITARFGELLGKAGKTFSPFFQIGPYFSLLAWADGKYDGYDLGTKPKPKANNEDTVEFEAKDDKASKPLRRIDAGLAIGAGSFISLGSIGVLSVDFRADIGLLNTADTSDYWNKPKEGRYYKQEIYNRQYQLAVGYHF